MTSRRKSKTLISLLAVAVAGTLATAGAVSATTPPDSGAAGSEAPAGSAAAGGSGGVGEVGGSGCGIPHGAYEDPGVEASGEVRAAYNQAAYSMNQNTTHGNSVYNVNPQYLITAGGFQYYDADLNLINNDQFGTCTIESLDPLTITYHVNEGVTWDDGTQIDAADLLLWWASQSGNFNDASTVTTPDGLAAAADENGAPIIVGPDGADITSVDEAAYGAAFDPETGGLAEGYTYKESQGVAFDATSASLALVTQTPVITDDGLGVTATWDSFYVDYPVGGIFVGTPAHVVGQAALGIEDPAEAKQAVIDAITNADAAALKPIADFNNTGFDASAMPDNPGITLGYGPYQMTSWTDDGTMTFEANPNYTWGPKPQVQTIVYSVIGDPTAAVQAMENEEVDIIQPQATSDILVQLGAIADRGIVTFTGPGGTYEHVDLAVNNGGPFDPATYGGDADTALMVRQAFLKTIPRQEILDRLILPLDPTATIRNSFTQVPGSPEYDNFVANNGQAELYDTVDIAGAQQLLTDAGVTAPVDVRFMYAADNPRRASEYELIRDSAAQAGFNVIDGVNPDWGAQLSNTSIYDAALFGWQTSSIVVADSQANFATGLTNNFYGYSNPEVDALYEELQSTTDPARQYEILLEVEQHLVADGFGVTLFQHPGITAYNENYVAGVSSIPLSPTVFFNVWEWTVPAG